VFFHEEASEKGVVAQQPVAPRQDNNQKYIKENISDQDRAGYIRWRGKRFDPIEHEAEMYQS
jgi:hypothetical protein